MIEIDLDKISKNELATILVEKDKEIKRLNNTINKLQKSWREEIKQEIYRTLDIVRSDKE